MTGLCSVSHQSVLSGSDAAPSPTLTAPTTSPLCSPTAAEEDGASEEEEEEAEAPRQTGRTRKRGRRASPAGGSEEEEEEEDGGASSGGDASTEAPPPPSKVRRITFEKCGQCKVSAVGRQRGAGRAALDGGILGMASAWQRHCFSCARCRHCCEPRHPATGALLAPAGPLVTCALHAFTHATSHAQHCLNPKLKKACKVVMLQRQELGLRRRI